MMFTGFSVTGKSLLPVVNSSISLINVSLSVHALFDGTMFHGLVVCCVGLTGASWSKNCIFPNSDFRINLLLLV